MGETVNADLSIEKIEPLPENTVEKQLYWHAKRSSWFGCILYPDEDRRHKVFMDYLEKDKVLYPKYVYILHDRDIWTPLALRKWISKHPKDDPPELGSLKKPHIHIIFNRARSCPPSTVKKYFGCWVDHFEAISDSVSYIKYMLHTNPESLEDGKPLYRPDELIGDPRVIRQAIIQNAKCVSLNEIFDYISSGDIGSVKETVDRIRRDKPDLFLGYLEVWKEYGYIINQYCRDTKEQNFNDFIASFAFDSVDSETKEKLSKLFWKGSRLR